MTESFINGNSGWTKWLVSIIWGVLVLVLITTVNNVIANDKDSRARDEAICTKIVINKEERMKETQLILVALAEIKSELGYIRRQVVTNGKTN